MNELLYDQVKAPGKSLPGGIKLLFTSLLLTVGKKQNKRQQAYVFFKFVMNLPVSLCDLLQNQTWRHRRDIMVGHQRPNISVGHSLVFLTYLYTVFEQLSM